MTDTQTLWKNGTYIEQDEPEKIITVEDISNHETDWSIHNESLGLRLEPGDDLDALDIDVSRFKLIIVNFPSFADGRGFSTARILREKYGFDGEIRASGAYILDQMPMLMRCGVDTFDIQSSAVRKGLEAGKWTDIPMYYQPAFRTGQIAGNTAIHAKDVF